MPYVNCQLLEKIITFKYWRSSVRGKQQFNQKIRLFESLEVFGKGRYIT